MQKRALAGAGRGHDRNHLTFDKFQVYRSKDNQLRRACSVRFAQSARLKNYAAGCFCQARRHEAARCCCSVSSAHLVVVRLPALSLETRSTLIRLDAEYGGWYHLLPNRVSPGCFPLADSQRTRRRSVPTTSIFMARFYLDWFVSLCNNPLAVRNSFYVKRFPDASAVPGALLAEPACYLTNVHAAGQNVSAS